MNKALFTGKINWGHLSFYFLILAVLLAQVLVFVFYVPAQVSQVLSDRETVDQDATEVATLISAVAIVKTLDKTGLNHFLAMATAALPDEKKTAGVVAGMSTLAGNYGVAVKSLEFSPGLISTSSAAVTGSTLAETSVGNGVKQISATLNMAASLPSLMAFLKGLNQTSQVIGVSSVDFSGSVGQANSAGLALQIYYQPPRQFVSSTAAKSLKILSAQDTQLLESLPEKDVFTVPSE